MADRNRSRHKPGRPRESGREGRRDPAREGSRGPAREGSRGPAREGRRDPGRDDRGFVDRAQDEVRSWFGDDSAARRRHRDVMGGDRAPVARGAQAPLGMAYNERSRPRRGTSGPRPGGGGAGQMDRVTGPGEPHRREYDPSGAVQRGWNEPNYGYRPAAGFDSTDDPQDEPGWDMRSIHGYGVQWRGGRGGPRGPYVGRGPKGYQRTDARILEEVCDRLADAPDVDAGEIEVEVREGEVTMTGTVQDRWQKRRAEDVIEYVSGVREVHNQLRLARPDTT